MRATGIVTERRKQAAPGAIGPLPGAPVAQAPVTAAGIPRFLREWPLQTKLRVNHPGDAFEQEAERIAGQIAQPAPAPAHTCACGGSVAAAGECATCRARRLDSPANLIQRSLAPGGGGAANPLAGGIGSSGAPLESADRAHFEAALGTDLRHVRLHTTAASSRAADALQARAFTAGSDIYFRDGQYVPGSATSRRLLAHELVHVVQQTAGAVPNGPQLRAAGSLIQRQLCEDPDEIVQGALPDLLQEAGYVPPPPEVLAEMLTMAEFEARTGVPADQLPADNFVGVDRLHGGGVLQGPNVLPDPTHIAGPAGLGGVVGAPLPMSVVPGNSIGLLWTSGHLSVFANVEGSLNVRGFRGNLAWHAGADVLPGPVGRWFNLQLTLGVSGAMRGDRLFTMMGNQSVIFVEVDAPTARAFSAELTEARYNEPYRYSPPDPNARSATERAMAERVLRARGPAQAVMCTNNCITVPVRQVEAVLGGHPTAQGVDVATGRRAGGAYDPYAHGRARLMTEYMRRPDLTAGRPGLSTVTMTPAAARAIGYIRVGGGVLMLYGGYQTGRRLVEAWGTEDFPLVAMQEGFTWTGAIAGSMAGAAAGAVVCAPGGPISLVCAVGGALGGLVGGMIGGAIGSMIIPVVVTMVNGMITAVLVLVEGLMAVQQIGQGFQEGFANAVFSGILTERNKLNPCNWELQNLSQRDQNDITAVGLFIWHSAGTETADSFLAHYRRPLNSYAVPASLLNAIAEGMTRAARRGNPSFQGFTADSLGGLTPTEFVGQLQQSDLLRFKYDPALLARIMMLPDGQPAH